MDISYIFDRSIDEFAALLARNRVRIAKVDQERSISKIFTHKNPHLDEYMALLFFRAALSEKKRHIPLYETIVSGDDISDKNLWRGAAVIGIGSDMKDTLGAALILDEHNKKKNPNVVFNSMTGFSHQSVSMLTKDKYIGASARLPAGLHSILSEVNHIDAYGGAYAQSLSTYIKNIHETIGDDNNVENCGGRVKQKETIVYAVIVSALLALERHDKLHNTAYWKNAVDKSIDSFIKQTTLAGRSGFAQAAKQQRFFCTNAMEKALYGDKVYMKNPYADNLNESKFIVDNSGRPIRQRLLIPCLVPAVMAMWGEEIGGAVLDALWEASLTCQMDFNDTMEILETLIKNNMSADIDVSGDGYKCQFLRANQFSFIFFESSLKGKNAVNGFLNKHCGGNGFSMTRDLKDGGMVLTKGSKISDELWKKMVNMIIAKEGSSADSPPGCWHKVENLNGYAPFIINGNSAHRYVPKSTLNCADLAKFAVM